MLYTELYATLDCNDLEIQCASAEEEMAEANDCLNAVKESAEPDTAKEGLSQMDGDSGQVSILGIARRARLPTYLTRWASENSDKHCAQ